MGDTNFTEADLYFAYRKAKADLFFEKSIPCAKKFALYEESLQENISKLTQRINNASHEKWFNDIDSIGKVSFVPKSFDPGHNEILEPKFLSSNAIDNWKRLFKQKDDGQRKLRIEFRPMADFQVDMHVVASLWINTVGHKFDACLRSSALGARLRRVGGSKSYHINVWQSFVPYFQSYKKWRDDGFNAIRKELDAGRKVVALTLDLRRFFHQIDGNFLLDERYQDVLRRIDSDFKLTDRDRALTEQLLGAFKTWADIIPGRTDDAPPGLPVGCTASRVIANVALVEFDKLIEEKLMPIYYARYVDDIFLVLKDSGNFGSGMDVLTTIVERMKPYIKFKPRDRSKTMQLKLPYTNRSKLEFQTEKQRVFLIDDHDLLDAIKAKVDEVSSEWRLLPDLSQFGRSAAAKALSTSKDGNNEGDALRKTDTLSLKRLSFAVLLRNADALVDALPPKEWKKQRAEFYDFSMRHIIAPDKLFELTDYIPRLIQIAVSCQDWSFPRRLISTLVKILKELSPRTDLDYMGKPQSQTVASKIWDNFFRHLRNAFEESLLTSVRPTQKPSGLKLYKSLYDQIREFHLELEDLFDAREEMHDAERVFCRDLARQPFKSLLLKEVRRKCSHVSSPPSNLPDLMQEKANEAKELLARVGASDQPVMPLLFPTRPLGPEDLSILVPNSALDIEQLKRWLNTVRGTHYQVNSDAKATETSVASIGYGKWNTNPKIAVTSFLTEDSSWACAAGRSPDLSASRYQQLVLLRQAILKTSKPARPRYVVFPELSIPSKWMRTFAEPLLKAGISVIAGEEYTHHGPKNQFVDNTARLMLTDNRLGYQTWISLVQLKGVPAHIERDNLRSQFGLRLKPSQKTLSKKLVYSHHGFKFGLLICSELTDMANRLHFRGKVDGLFVLSWNRDLESFASLIDASALDIHCFVGIVNNRKYGDSRVRSPYKDAWLRDAVRVKGGLADYFVVAEIDVQSLRDFQCHKEPPEGPFKPFPEGFVVSRARKLIPGSKK
jgi:hypothetical protein